MVSKISEGVAISVETFFQPEHSNAQANEYMFAYRITIGPVVFIEAGMIALGIALATLAWLSIKAAMGNPVRTLRNE